MKGLRHTSMPISVAFCAINQHCLDTLDVLHVRKVAYEYVKHLKCTELVRYL